MEFKSQTDNSKTTCLNKKNYAPQGTVHDPMYKTSLLTCNISMRWRTIVIILIPKEAKAI